MKLGSEFLRATALSAMLVLTGCEGDSENDNNVSVVTQSVVGSKQISTGDIISSLEDGIHRITIPAAISGQSEDQVHVIVKDYKSYHIRKGVGYVLNLGEFSSTTQSSVTEISAETVEGGNFISELADGIHELEVDGKAFPDGQDRTFKILKDYKNYHLDKAVGYSTVLSSSLDIK